MWKQLFDEYREVKQPVRTAEVLILSTQSMNHIAVSDKSGFRLLNHCQHLHFFPQFKYVWYCAVSPSWSSNWPTIIGDAIFICQNQKNGYIHKNIRKVATKMAMTSTQLYATTHLCQGVLQQIGSSIQLTRHSCF